MIAGISPFLWSTKKIESTKRTAFDQLYITNTCPIFLELSVNRGHCIPVGLIENLLHEMQMRLATNMICRWTLREYRWKLKWRRSINSVLHELRALPPSKSFWGGIDYLEAERDWQKRCVQ